MASVIRFLSASYQIRHTYQHITYTQLHLEYAHNNSIAYSFLCLQTPERRTVYKSRINLICSQDSSLYCVTMCMFVSFCITLLSPWKCYYFCRSQTWMSIPNKSSALVPKTHLFLHRMLTFLLVTNNCSKTHWLDRWMHVDIGPLNLFHFFRPIDAKAHISCAKNNKDFHTHTHTLTLAWMIPFSCLKYQSIAWRDCVRFERSALCVIRFGKFKTISPFKFNFRMRYRKSMRIYSSML